MFDGTYPHLLHWREPFWLLFAFVGPLILSVLSILSQRRFDCYADAELKPWTRWPADLARRKRLLVRLALYLSSWILMCIALAGPRTVADTPSVADVPELNIMIVVDASRSMRVGDVQPDRLKRAGIEIAELMQRMKHANLGVLLYTSTAHLLVPFTRDHDTVAYYLRQLEQIAMPTYGSRPLAALRLARKEIESAHGKPDAAIIWITDGDRSGLSDQYLDQLNSFVLETADSIPLYILGIGSVEGDAIPADEGWLESNGRPVISRLHEQWLSELATAGNGSFSLVQADDTDWQRIYDDGILKHTSKKINDEGMVVWNELYHWALLPALVLLIPGLIPVQFKRQGKNSLPVVLLLLLLIPGSAENPVYASSSDDAAMQAGDAYNRENFKAAAQYYSSIPGFTGLIGTGNSYYRMHNYRQAASQYRQAVIQASNDQQRGISIYNLANATFMTGDYTLAARLYRDALLYRPLHEKTRSNLALSESLEKQVEEQLNQAMARRVGSGPSSRRAEAGLDINDSASLSLDSDEETRKILSAIPKKQLDHMLALGIEHARIASSSRDKNPGMKRWQQEANQARIRMRELEDQQAILWKRLFEMEDGYPASLETPEKLPGVLPW